MAEAGGGAIVHICSISGMVADRPAAYAAMKAAVVNDGRALAEELARPGFGVNVIARGSIHLPGGAWDIRRTSDPARYAKVRAGVPFERFGTPEEVAAGGGVPGLAQGVLGQRDRVASGRWAGQVRPVTAAAAM